MAIGVSGNIQLAANRLVTAATARKTSTARSRRFREKVAEMGYRRMEITADVTTIEHLRAVARVRKLDTYEALELAVKLLVRWHNADVASDGRTKS